MRDAHREAAAVDEHAMRFGDRAVGVFDVHQAHRRDDGVDGRCGDAAQGRGVRPNEADVRQARIGGARAGRLDQPRAAVDGDDVRAAPGELARVAAFAAAEIQDRPAANVANQREHPWQQEVIAVVVGVGVRDPVVGDEIPRTGRAVVVFVHVTPA